ncbi:hypothetical protein [Nocardia sp. CDC160]|uniref:hypothetical protein n=1 Tax=Nocardia sp. CDC160 TaxID=3112166 RepID=UPI002DB68CE9|nr:hypothetical protein [Nocardia sp. CDC160]MEC3917389.1 hypothetical protein [Nocardia sp. CDC160]
MIDITSREMTSDISPEFAVCETRRGEVVWRLSWLPTRRLTREQAWAGMELDEVLSDPAIVHDAAAHLWAADLARCLGIGVERAVVLLAQRLAERMSSADVPRGSEKDIESEALLAGVVSSVRGSAASGPRSRNLWG